MTITYEMTPADHWALNRYIYTHNWLYGGLRLLYTLFIPGITLVTMRTEGVPWSVAILSALIVLVVWAILVYVLLRWSSTLRLKAWPKPLRQIRLTIDETGLHVNTPQSENNMSWDVVSSVARDRHAVYLFLSPRLAYIAPLRAFASPADADIFLEFARTHAGRTL